MSKIFIAISGNIGAGKTTFTRLLAEALGWKAHYEEVKNNPYLEDFYQDMERWSFPLQVFFLNSRFQAHQKILSSSQYAIQDRSIYEDAHIFARNLHEEGKMSQRDYENYLALYQAMNQFLRPPHLMVYLRRSVDQLMQRVKKRGRGYEKNLPASYLEHLQQLYDQWMETYQLGKKLILNTDGLDFLQNKKHFWSLAEQVLDALGEKENLLLHTQRQKVLYFS